MFSSMRKNDLTPESILTMVVERLRSALPDHALRPTGDDPFRLQLCHPEAGEMMLNLGNLVYEIHGSPPETIEKMITSYISMAKQALGPTVIYLDCVFPALRHYQFFDAVDRPNKDPLIGEGPGDLISVVLNDLGDGLATLTQDAVESAGHSPEEILHAAEQNFVQLLPSEVYSTESTDSVVSIGLENYPWLGTSLLFVPSVVTQVMMHNDWSRVLVSAPTRETIDVVDANEPDAMKRMERWMHRHLSQPRSQSEFVLSMSLDDEYLTTTHRMSSGRLLGLN